MATPRGWADGERVFRVIWVGGAGGGRMGEIPPAPGGWWSLKYSKPVKKCKGAAPRKFPPHAKMGSDTQCTFFWRRFCRSSHKILGVLWQHAGRTAVLCPPGPNPHCLADGSRLFHHVHHLVACQAVADHRCRRHPVRALAWPVRPKKVHWVSDPIFGLDWWSVGHGRITPTAAMA